MTTFDAVESPCVGICALNTERICVGCGRSNEEVAQWLGMPRAEKEQCLEVAKRRLHDMLPKEE